MARYSRSLSLLLAAALAALPATLLAAKKKPPVTRIKPAAEDEAPAEPEAGACVGAGLGTMDAAVSRVY